MTITDDYLAAFAQRGPKASELQSAALRDMAGTWYQTGCLSRPVFLAAIEFRQLTADLEVLHQAVTTLPDRLFGGDLAAFARAVGLVEPQVRAVLRGRGNGPTRLCRPDLYKDENGFHLLELNMGSNLGGLDNAVLNQAMIEQQPFVAEFVAENQLTFVDTMAELTETIFAETKVPTGSRPFMAAVEWPGRYPELEALLTRAAGMFEPLGIDCLPCPIDRLEYRDDRIWLDGRQVDIVYRLFHLEDVTKPGMAELLEPLLRTVEDERVAMFTPMDSELYGSKGVLAFVSDEAHRHLYSSEELAALDRILPWTRMVRPDLAGYAEQDQAELVLKPVAEHGGQGVVLGWQVDPGTWRERLAAAMATPRVIQRRIRPVPELFPTDDGLEPWLLTWGPFLVARGFGGFWLRGSRDLDGGVVNMATGAVAACCFHQD